MSKDTKRELNHNDDVTDVTSQYKSLPQRVRPLFQMKCSYSSLFGQLTEEELSLNRNDGILLKEGNNCVSSFNTKVDRLPRRIDEVISIGCRILEELKHDFVCQLRKQVY